MFIEWSYKSVRGFYHAVVMTLLGDLVNYYVSFKKQNAKLLLNCLYGI